MIHAEPALTAARADAIAWARQRLGRADVVILDTETTGLGQTAEVLQIAVLATTGETLLDALVRPIGPIDPSAMAVHGITSARVATLPSFASLSIYLGRLLKDRHVVVYNAAFDRRVLEQTYRATKQSWENVQPRAWECAMRHYSAFVGEWSDARRAFRWQKLPRAAGQGAHCALTDCRTTLAVVRQMAEAVE